MILAACLVIFLAVIPALSQPSQTSPDPVSHCGRLCPAHDQSFLPLDSRISGLASERFLLILVCYYPQVPHCRYGLNNRGILIEDSQSEENRCEGLAPCSSEDPDSCTCPKKTGTGLLHQNQSRSDERPPDAPVLFCLYGSQPNSTAVTQNLCRYTFDNGTLLSNTHESCPQNASASTESSTRTMGCPTGQLPTSTSASSSSMVSSSLTSVTTSLSSLSPSSLPLILSSTVPQTSSVSSQTSLGASPSSAGQANPQTTGSPNSATISLSVVAGAAVLFSLVLLSRNRRNSKSPASTQPGLPTSRSSALFPYHTLSTQQPSDPSGPESSFPLIPDRLSYTPRGLELSFNGPQYPESLNSPPGQTKSLHSITNLSRHNTPIPSGSSTPRATPSVIYQPPTSPSPANDWLSRPEPGPSRSRSPLINGSQLEEQAFHSVGMSSPDTGPQVQTLRVELALLAPQPTVPDTFHPPPLYTAES